MKRIISLMLAFVMLVSLLPVVTAEDTGLTTVKYDFNQVPEGTTGDYTAWYTYENTKNLFWFKYKTCKEDTYGSTVRFSRRNGAGDYAIFEIQVPKTAQYDVFVDWETLRTNVKFDLYIGPNGNTSDTLVGSLYADTAKARAEEKVSSQKVSLQEGLNYLVFRIPQDFAIGSSTDGFLVPYSVTLTGGGEDVLMSAQITGFENGKVNVRATMADGSDLDLSKATVKYESSNKSVVTVDSDGNTTEVGPGSSTVKVTVEYKGIKKTSEKEYYIPKGNITAKYNFHQVTPGTAGNFSAWYTYANTNDLFRFLSLTCKENTHGDATAGVIRFSRKNGSGDFSVFEINVPETGDYDVYVDWEVVNGKAGFELHLFEWDQSVYSSLTTACMNIPSENAVGVLSSNAAKGRTEDKLTEEKIHLEKGTYYLMFRVVPNWNAVATDGWLIPYSVTLNGGPNSIFVGAKLTGFENGKVNLNIAMSDGKPFDVADANVTYESSNEGVVDIDDNGNIAEVAPGTCTISATIEIGGIIKTVQKEYYISDGGITVKYNFGERMSELGFGAQSKLSEMDFYKTYGFYEVIDSTYDEQDGNGMTFEDKYLKIPANGAYVSFEVGVPKDAIYTLKTDVAKIADGGNVDVYVNPKDSYDIASLGEKAGSYNSAAGAAGTVAAENLTLSEGNYVITFVANDAENSASNPLFGTISSFSLVSGDSKGKVLTGMGMQIMKNGQVEVFGVMSDGSRVDDIGGATVAYESSDKSIAEIDENGLINDVSAGGCEIYATATIGMREIKAKSAHEALRSDYGADVFCDLGTELTNLGITSGSKLPFSLISFDATNGFYRFFSGSVAYEYQGLMQGRPRNITIRHNNYIAFEVFFPQAGIYDMEMWNAATDAGADVHVYMSKGAASTNEEDLVGTYRCYDSEIVYGQSYFRDIVKTPTVLKNFRVSEPGYYVLTFKSDATWLKDTISTWDYAYGSVGSFRLTSGDDEVLMGVLPDEGEYISLCPDKKVIEYTDPAVPGTTVLRASARKFDGTAVEKVYDSLSFESDDETIAKVDSATGLITAVGDGSVEMSAVVKLGGKTYTGAIDVVAYDNTGVESAELQISSELYVRESRKAQLVAKMRSGNYAKVPGETVTFTEDPKGFVSIAADGTVTGVSENEGTIRAVTNFRGDDIDVSATVKVTKHKGKTNPTYYTWEKRAIAQENIQKYDWARSAKNSVVNAADRYLDNYEILYNLIPREGLPRARQVSNPADDEYYKYCRYCGGDVEGATAGGYGGWAYDTVGHPWKIQCTLCKRRFPTNDFATLYQYGLDENGVYDAERAKRVNAEKVAEGGKNALVNELYPEIGTIKSINNGRGLRPGETVEGWGVDDGWGYRPKDENGNNYRLSGGEPEIHCYIPRFVWCLWDDFHSAIVNLGTAYVYTGDEKYGRAGAILLDRFADLIPEYDINHQYLKDGMNLNPASFGYVRNSISDVDTFVEVLFATDALFPMTADSQVQDFLSAKAEELGLENKKETREDIWNNWKDRILLELFYNGVKKGRLTGNFGMYQRFAAILAVSLAEEPESGEIIDWIYSAGDSAAAIITGGNVLPQLVDEICRDGFGTESGDNYLAYWYGYSYAIGEILEGFETDKKVDLWEHPKFARMFTAFQKKILAGNQLAQVGDSAAPASIGMTGDMNAFLDAYMKYKDTDFGKEIAQYIYTKNHFNVDSLHYDIFTRNPESIQDEIRDAVTASPKQKADLMAGYGFAILRDGEMYETAQGGTSTNSLRDAWIYFGAAKSHFHQDNLNLGLEAFGLNLAPDNGYPERTGKDANRYQWHNSTIAHNTVVVDEKNSTKPAENNGTPMHFDDTSFVKLVDVDANASYDVTDKYRRTLVMVKVNDDISYTMDFFRITGGDSHIYSFHSQAENAVPVEGLTMTPQKNDKGEWIGTYISNIGPDGKEYVGVDVPYQDLSGSWTDANGKPYIFTKPGQDPHTVEAWEYETYFPKGFTWLSKIRRDAAPKSEFAVEFEVEDYRKSLVDGKGIRLRLTQLNSFTADEVALAGGMMPRKSSSAVLPETFDYVLVKREGKNLDSLYATVFEPYRNERYIESIERCAVSGVSANDPTVSAIKITHVGGKRIDYVVYSEDNTKTLNIDGVFNFRGFVGVYSVNENGEVLNRYINDGDIISADGSATGETVAYTGMVSDFDREMEFGDFENYIDVKINERQIDDELISDITGRWIYIANDGVENAAYEILGAEKLSEDTLRLDTGNVTNIRKYIDAYDTDEGYVYNISEGDSFRIPLSFSEDASPRFNNPEKLSDLTATAGSSIKLTVNASSPIIENPPQISYVGATLPRGASVNETTGEITWKPDSSQIGDVHFAITAKDTDGRENTIHFMIKVLGSTTGSPSQNEDSTDSTDTPSGGGGGGDGGGGGAAPTPDTGDDTKPDDGETTNPDEGDDTSVGEDIPVLPSSGFTDLGSHAWAEDAINELAEAGIIKGTSETTFSPANNITRADFALLLVRAFDLKSDSTENFADVSESDYFASELAIARNCGIVGGIGDNKYAPRNTITRQDMMVIVYRALKTLGIELETGEVSYPDFTDVAPYAEDAVSALITAGLVNGKNGKIDPTAYTTRAEVAVLIKRILDYVK